MAVANPNETALRNQFSEDLAGYHIDNRNVQIPRCRCSISTQARCQVAMATKGEIIRPGTKACHEVIQSR